MKACFGDAGMTPWIATQQDKQEKTKKRKRKKAYLRIVAHGDEVMRSGLEDEVNREGRRRYAHSDGWEAGGEMKKVERDGRMNLK